LNIRMIRLTAFLFFLLPAGVWAGVTTITLNSDPGDYIGQGGSYVYTNANSLITTSPSGGHLYLQVDGDEKWRADFQLPSNYTELTPGTYTNLTRYPFHDKAVGGLSWSGEGRGCNTLTGWIIINKATYVSGALTELDMQFAQYCSGGTAGLYGDIKWYADDTTVPPGPVTPIPEALWNPDPALLPATGNFVYLESDVGDYIGGGLTYSYNEPYDTISVSAFNNRVTVGVGGWTGNFVGMNTLDTLEVGYYGDLQRYPFNNPAKGGLSWYGNGRGCNKLSGWFAVDSVRYSGTELAEIQIRFEQHCEGGDPALNGIIKWVNPDLPPAAPVLTGYSQQRRSWIKTTLNWSTEAAGVDVYYNGQLVDSFDQQTTSATYSHKKRYDQVYSVCNTGTQDCSEYIANIAQ